MDDDPVAYSPILHRPQLRWPNGARVALWVVPNIEHYEYMPKRCESATHGHARRIRMSLATPNGTTATGSGYGGCCR